MKNYRIVIMAIALVSFIGCGGGGGTTGSTGNPSKLYVAKLTDGGTEIGTVFTDDAGNSIVSIKESATSDVVKSLMGKFHDGSVMSVEMQNGVPVSATDGTTTAWFSNWTGSTVDVTFTSGNETETVEDVNFSEYTAMMASKGWGEFATATWTTLTVAFCPVSLGLAGLSMGAGFPAAIAGCSLAATNLYLLLNKQPTVLEQAATYVTAPFACSSIQQGGGTISEAETCASSAGQSASSNPSYITASGEVSSDDGDDGGGGDGTILGNCRIQDTCTDYALIESGLDQARESCIAAGGTFSYGGCSTSTALGSCTVDTGTPAGDYVIVYYPPTYTLEIAQQHCAVLNGQWSS